MSEEAKLRMYVLSGGPQDLSNLHLTSLRQAYDMMYEELSEVPNAEIEEMQYTLEVKLMTQKEIDDLPDYEF